LEYDYAAIEASFAMQYGIRLALEDLALGEFLRLLAGIMPDTPLGRLVSVRSETNLEVVKGFGAAERKIRREWNRREALDSLGSSGSLDSSGSSGYLDSLQKLQDDLARVFG
jgi:hypothetical protein